MGGEAQPDGTIVGKGLVPAHSGPRWATAPHRRDPDPQHRAAGGCGRLRFRHPHPGQVPAFDWEGYAAEILEGFDRENKALECCSLVGFFERMHALIGF